MFISDSRSPLPGGIGPPVAILLKSGPPAPSGAPAFLAPLSTPAPRPPAGVLPPPVLGRPPPPAPVFFAAVAFFGLGFAFFFAMSLSYLSVLSVVWNEARYIGMSFLPLSITLDILP